MDNHVSFGNIVFGLASARPTPQGLSGAPDYGLGGQFPPISSHILGVAHLCHAEKMEFLVAAINEIITVR